MEKGSFLAIKSQSKHTRISIWASIVSAVMLIGIGVFWMATSLAFFYVAWNPSETALFRFLMVAVFIGGLVRAAALVNYPATPFFIFLILIELIPTTLMLWFQAKLLNSGSL